MIYSKKTIFPHPILYNNCTEYISNKFEIDVDLSQNSEKLIFEIKDDISSNFVKDLIRKGKVKKILIIQTQDNYYFDLDTTNYIEIDSNKIFMEKNTELQMYLQAIEDICFESNNDLSDFYNEFKKNIIIKKDMCIGFSNVIKFSGSKSNPFELFEKKLNSSLKSDINVTLTEETIVIEYKNQDTFFFDIDKKSIINMYLYLGLQKALINFIDVNTKEKLEDAMIKIDELSEIDDNTLNSKLIKLLKSKKIDSLYMDNLDEVIHLISDGLVKKYVNAVRGLYERD